MQSRFKTNSHSAARPHVGTDPVSVRPHQIRAEYIMRSVDRIGKGIGQTRGLSLHAAWRPSGQTLFHDVQRVVQREIIPYTICRLFFLDGIFGQRTEGRFENLIQGKSELSGNLA